MKVTKFFNIIVFEICQYYYMQLEYIHFHSCELLFVVQNIRKSSRDLALPVTLAFFYSKYYI